MGELVLVDLDLVLEGMRMDIAERLQLSACSTCQEAAEEIRRLRGLLKNFVTEFESEDGLSLILYAQIKRATRK